MELEFAKEELEDLRAWWEDPRGKPFKQVLREMFAAGVSKMRQHARAGDAVQNAFFASHVDTLEEVLDLPGIIIQDYAEEARKEAASGKKV